MPSHIKMIFLILFSGVYLVFILILMAGISKAKPFHGNGNENHLPTITVIIAFRNEEENLPALFGDLKNLVYPKKKLEIILVDDHSEDRSKTLSLDFCDSQENCRLLVNSGQGKKAAFKTGIEESRHSLIVKTDADCRFGENWLLTLGRFKANSGADMVIAPVILEESKTLLSKFAALEFLSLTGSAASMALLNRPVMCNGANMAVKKDVFFDRVNAMNDAFASGDDSFLLYSLKKDRMRSVQYLFSAEATVTSKAPDTPKDFFEQRKRWVSKSAGVRDVDTIITALFVLLINSALAAMMVVGLFYIPFLIPAIGFYGIKMALDFIFLRKTAGVFNRKFYMRWFLPVSLAYPFYVVISAFGGLFGKFSWKNRVYRA